MFRHFVDTASSSRSYTMFTSIWSHKDVWHLGMNMAALHSFGPVLMDIMGRHEFMAFYVTSGLAASLASRIGRRLTPTDSAVSGSSLGASGAIFGVVRANGTHLIHA
jgi:rhomboid-like protein